MSLSLAQSKTALLARLTASFAGGGGTEPYGYAVLPGGAGGSIDSVTGLYTAPTVTPTDPKLAFDTIQVTDDDSATATARILVGSPLLLFCEILEKELELGSGRVYVWNQKKFQPHDAGLVIVVSVPVCKPFANTLAPDPSTGWADAVQSVNMLARLDLDVISRDMSAFNRKEEIILALNSLYSQSQQEANSFSIGQLPTAFQNLSGIDGAAIPFRYRISVNMQYAFTKVKAAEYFDDFEKTEIATQP